MKKILIPILLLTYCIIQSQSELPFFEQIAFDLYQNTIIKDYPTDKKIRIPRYTSGLHPTYGWFYIGKCLTGEYLVEANVDSISYSYADENPEHVVNVFDEYKLEQQNFDSPTHIMNYDGLNKKHFRIKNSRTERYPYLRISTPYHKNNDYDEYYMNIIEYHKKWSIRYFVLIDRDGNVIKWCRDDDVIVTKYHN